MIRPRNTRWGIGIRLGIGLWMAGVIVGIFLVVPQHEGLGTSGRIMILHVPTAWVSVMAFTVSAWYSARYLWRGTPTDDDYALAAAEGGFLFTILATITGMIFSQQVWGIFWNWDPRQTSIFVLLLIYAALFALRASLEQAEQRKRLSAVYSLFAFVSVPFLVFVAPRLAESTLHPNCALLPGSKCDGIELGVGKIGLLGDRKIQLLELEVQGDELRARVKVSEPGLQDEHLLTPTYDLANHKPVAMVEIPGARHRLQIQRADVEKGVVRINIQAPGTGMLHHHRTLMVFLASIVGFSGLFFWMLQVRATLLGVQWRLAHQLVQIGA